MTKFSNYSYDTLGYYQIARSFINSFSINPNEGYWKKFVKENSIPKTTITATKIIKHGTTKNCMIVGQAQTCGFYKEPFYDTDGTLLIPFDILKHPDSLIYENMLLFNNELYTFNADSIEAIYSIPHWRQPGSTYSIKFGYLLKNDSANCSLFYNQVLEINPRNDLK
jgi:hypothetical protein